ncbi:MAG: glycosyltransferase, partial [Hyphomicrobiales bacterium]|nr:glycosyltransferase [Hyphomicrobiales bacterium]
MRAPVGGLFRHVCDLVAAQADMGHAVGVICDSRSGGATAAEQLGRLAVQCSLGVKRVPMSRQIGLRDITAYRAVRWFVLDSDAEILHGHGAKGGAYARLVARGLKKQTSRTRAIYTLHGGSLHYDPDQLMGRVFLDLERRLAPHTDSLIFESAYSAGLYEAKVGPLPCEGFIVPNGLWPHEFYDVVLDIDAADFLFVGELRELKGVDLLLKALARMQPA